MDIYQEFCMYFSLFFLAVALVTGWIGGKIKDKKKGKQYD